MDNNDSNNNIENSQNNNNRNNNNRNNGGDNKGDNGGNGGKKNNQQQGIAIILLTTLVTMGVIWFMYTWDSSTSQEIPYNEFVEMLEEGQISEVVVDSVSGTIDIVLKDEYIDDNALISSYYTIMIPDTQLLERLETANANGELVYKATLESSNAAMIYSIISIVFPFILMIIIFNMIFKKMGKGGGIMGVGKNNAKLYVQQSTGVTFKDVAGQDEAKESLQEVVDFLHNPEKYTGIGAKLPKGALLVGPPGTGKTLLAKAVAGEANVPFFSLSGSSFVEMYVGVGASRVRDLFKEAQKAAPCIVFIDEIDAIGKSRDNAMGGNDEREQTLNQLLTEMDGFETNKGLLLLAATNRPEVLDPALLRPGRFDRRIVIDKPDLKGRVDVLKVHVKDVKIDETVDFEGIALATSGAVGSDLANMINEAAINAVKHGREAVSQKDLLEAVEVVLVGKEKKDRVLSKEERRIVSYHEVGHALVSALQKDSEPVQKITIVPRTMGALGYVMHTPEEEKFLNTKKELEAMLVGYLAGRAAEEIVFDTVTTGASNDIEQATKIARCMITQYGMSEKFGLIGLESLQNRYLDGRAISNCGEATSAEIDQEVMKMLKESYELAKTMLREHRKTMDQIADFLIEKETITGKEFMKIFREAEGLPLVTDEDVKQTRIHEKTEAEDAVQVERDIVIIDNFDDDEPSDIEEEVLFEENDLPD